MLGKAEEAAAVFVEAIEASRKVSPGTFTKAYASLHTFTSEQIADMEAALQYLQNVRGKTPPVQRRMPCHRYHVDLVKWRAQRTCNCDFSGASIDDIRCSSNVSLAWKIVSRHHLHWLAFAGPSLIVHAELACTHLYAGSRQPGSTKPKRQRPGREAALAADWDWLQDTSKADESWLHFALFSAYQKQVSRRCPLH